MPQQLGKSSELKASRSPDRFREKLPTFKPKPIEQIIGNNSLRLSAKGAKASSIPEQQQPSPIQKKPEQSQSKAEQKPEQNRRNSLEGLITSCGRNFEVESLEMDTSQLDDQFDLDSFKHTTSLYEKPKINVQQPNTPQYTPFSKTNSKESNPFTCKDDGNFLSFGSISSASSKWDGNINMVESVNYDDEDTEEESLKNQKVEHFIKPFLCKGNYYIEAINKQSGSSFLLEKPEQQFNLSEIKEHVFTLQLKMQCGKFPSSKSSFTKQAEKYVFLLETDCDESYFMTNEKTSEAERSKQFEELLRKSILSMKKYIPIYYRFERPSKQALDKFQ